MSDQEIRAVFDALEPRLSRIVGKWWIRAGVAAVIVACMFVLVTSGTAFQSAPSPGGDFPIHIGGTPNARLAGGNQQGEGERDVWEANEDSKVSEASRPAGTRRRHVPMTD